MEEEALSMYRLAAEQPSPYLRNTSRAAHVSLLVETARYDEAVSAAETYLREEVSNVSADSVFPLRLAHYQALFASEQFGKLSSVIEKDEASPFYRRILFDSSRSWENHVDIHAWAAADFYLIWAYWYRDKPRWRLMLASYMQAYPYENIPETMFGWLGYEGGSGAEERIPGLPVSLGYRGKRMDFRRLGAGTAAFLRAKIFLKLKRYEESFQQYRRFLSEAVSEGTVVSVGTGGSAGTSGIDAFGSSEESGGSEEVLLLHLFSGLPGNEFVEAALAAGRVYEAIGTVEGLRMNLEDRPGSAAAHFWLLETEAYLQRRVGRFRMTYDLYDRALTLAPVSERERMRWYRFDSLVRFDSGRAVDELLNLVGEWEDQSYYNDVLFDLADRLVRARRWERIARAADILMRESRSFAAARFTFLAARAAEAGLYEAADEHIILWYEHSLRSGCGAGSANYYRIMAKRRLIRFGQGLSILKDETWWPFCSETEKAVLQPVSFFEKERRKVDKVSIKLMAGLIGNDLGEYAYRRYGGDRDFIGGLPGFIVRLWAQSLQDRGKYLEAVRLLSRYYEEAGSSITKEDLRILYPLAFEEIMEEVCARFGLPEYLFFALVREESLFSADISSAAGAVGLSQLMPSTAEDVASRIGMRIESLTDPRQNLTLGGWYLDHLMGRTDSYSQALFSYNGGITRLRRWLRENPDLPGDLLLEAIPYKETSHYGRKVLVSAMVYGYIYRGVSLLHIVDGFFVAKPGN